MWVRVLHAKLYAYALPGSTARQLFISSTLLDSLLLDRPRQTSRQTSTELDRRHMESGSTGSTVTRQARQARPRQHLDSASTAPRQLDSSTARAQTHPCPWSGAGVACPPSVGAWARAVGRCAARGRVRRVTVWSSPKKRDAELRRSGPRAHANVTPT